MMVYQPKLLIFIQTNCIFKLSKFFTSGAPGIDLQGTWLVIGVVWHASVWDFIHLLVMPLVYNFNLTLGVFLVWHLCGMHSGL